MKQTAVEWLIGRFHYEGFIGTYCSEEQIKSKRKMMIEIIDQAKAMEKQQIKDAWDNGFANGYDLGKYDDSTNPDDAEQYYNETYKNKKQ